MKLPPISPRFQPFLSSTRITNPPTLPQTDIGLLSFLKYCLSASLLPVSPSEPGSETSSEGESFVRTWLLIELVRCGSLLPLASLLESAPLLPPIDFLNELNSLLCRLFNFRHPLSYIKSQSPDLYFTFLQLACEEQSAALRISTLIWRRTGNAEPHSLLLTQSFSFLAVSLLEYSSFPSLSSPSPEARVRFLVPLPTSSQLSLSTTSPTPFFDPSLQLGFSSSVLALSTFSVSCKSMVLDLCLSILNQCEGHQPDPLREAEDSEARSQFSFLKQLLTSEEFSFPIQFFDSIFNSFCSISGEISLALLRNFLHSSMPSLLSHEPSEDDCHSPAFQFSFLLFLRRCALLNGQDAALFFKEFDVWRLLLNSPSFLSRKPKIDAFHHCSEHRQLPSKQNISDSTLLLPVCFEVIFRISSTPDFLYLVLNDLIFELLTVSCEQYSFLGLDAEISSLSDLIRLSSSDSILLRTFRQLKILLQSADQRFRSHPVWPIVLLKCLTLTSEPLTHFSFDRALAWSVRVSCFDLIVCIMMNTVDWIEIFVQPTSFSSNDSIYIHQPPNTHRKNEKLSLILPHILNPITRGAALTASLLLLQTSVSVLSNQSSQNLTGIAELAEEIIKFIVFSLKEIPFDFTKSKPRLPFTFNLFDPSPAPSVEFEWTVAVHTMQCVADLFRNSSEEFSAAKHFLSIGTTSKKSFLFRHLLLSAQACLKKTKSRWNETLKSTFLHHFLHLFKSILHSTREATETFRFISSKRLSTHLENSFGYFYEIMVKLVLLSEHCPGPSIILDLLDILFDSSFRGDFGSNSLPPEGLFHNQNSSPPRLNCPSIICILVGLLRHCPVPIQLFVLNTFLNLVSIKDSLVYLTEFGKLQPSMFESLIDSFPFLNSDSQLLALKLIQKLGSQRISVRQLKRVFRLLHGQNNSTHFDDQKFSTTRPPYTSHLLDTLQGMVKSVDDPEYFLLFHGPENSSLRLPPLRSWPFLKSYSFSTWFALDGNILQSSSHRPTLICIRQQSGAGIEIYLSRSVEGRSEKELKLVIEIHTNISTTSSRKDPHRLEIPLVLDLAHHNPAPSFTKWIHLSLSHTCNTWFKSEITVLLNGHVEKRTLPFPSFSEPIYLPTIGDVPPRLKTIFYPGQTLDYGFSGLMGAIYFFSEALTEAQLRGIYSLGPRYAHTFDDRDDSSSPPLSRNLDADSSKSLDSSLTSQIALAYNPAVLVEESFLSNITPEINQCLWIFPEEGDCRYHFLDSPTQDESDAQLRSRLMFSSLHAEMLPGVTQCASRLMGDALDCLGGLKVLLPLLPQLTLPESHSVENSDRFKVCDLSPKLQLCPKILLLFFSLFRDSAETDFFVRNRGIAILGHLMERLGPVHATLETLNMIIAQLERISWNPDYQDEIIGSILYNFRIWSSSPFSVQMRLVGFLQTFYIKQPTRAITIFPIQKLLFVLQHFYSRVSLHIPPVNSLSPPKQLSKTSFDFHSNSRPHISISDKDKPSSESSLAPEELVEIRSTLLQMIYNQLLVTTTSLDTEFIQLLHYITQDPIPRHKSEGLLLVLRVLDYAKVDENFAIPLLQSITNRTTIDLLLNLHTHHHEQVRLYALLCFCSILHLYSLFGMFPTESLPVAPQTKPAPLQDPSKLRSSSSDGNSSFDSSVHSSRSTTFQKGLPSSSIPRAFQSATSWLTMDSTLLPIEITAYLKWILDKLLLPLQRTEATHKLNLNPNSDFLNSVSYSRLIFRCFYYTMHGVSCSFLKRDVDLLESMSTTSDHVDSFARPKSASLSSSQENLQDLDARMFRKHSMDLGEMPEYTQDPSVMTMCIPMFLPCIFELISQEVFSPKVRFKCLVELQASLKSVENIEILFGVPHWQVLLLNLMANEQVRNQRLLKALNRPEDVPHTLEKLKNDFAKSSTILETLLQLFSSLHSHVISFGLPKNELALTRPKEATESEINCLDQKNFVSFLLRGKKPLEGTMSVYETLVYLRGFLAQKEIRTFETGLTFLRMVTYSLIRDYDLIANSSDSSNEINRLKEWMLQYQVWMFGLVAFDFLLVRLLSLESKGTSKQSNSTVTYSIDHLISNQTTPVKSSVEDEVASPPNSLIEGGLDSMDSTSQSRRRSVSASVPPPLYQLPPYLPPNPLTPMEETEELDHIWEFSTIILDLIASKPSIWKSRTGFETLSTAYEVGVFRLRDVMSEAHSTVDSLISHIDGSVHIPLLSRLQPSLTVNAVKQHGLVTPPTTNPYQSPNPSRSPLSTTSSTPTHSASFKSAKSSSPSQPSTLVPRFKAMGSFCRLLTTYLLHIYLKGGQRPDPPRFQLSTSLAESSSLPVHVQALRRLRSFLANFKTSNSKDAFLTSSIYLVIKILNGLRTTIHPSSHPWVFDGLVAVLEFISPHWTYFFGKLENCLISQEGFGTQANQVTSDSENTYEQPISSATNTIDSTTAPVSPLQSPKWSRRELGSPVPSNPVRRKHIQVDLPPQAVNEPTSFVQSSIEMFEKENPGSESASQLTLFVIQRLFTFSLNSLSESSSTKSTGSLPSLPSVPSLDRPLTWEDWSDAVSKVETEIQTKENKYLDLKFSDNGCPRDIQIAMDQFTSQVVVSRSLMRKITERIEFSSSITRSSETKRIRDTVKAEDLNRKNLGMLWRSMLDDMQGDRAPWSNGSETASDLIWGVGFDVSDPLRFRQLRVSNRKSDVFQFHSTNLSSNSQISTSSIISKPLDDDPYDTSSTQMAQLVQELVKYQSVRNVESSQQIGTNDSSTSEDEGSLNSSVGSADIASTIRGSQPDSTLNRKMSVGKLKEKLLAKKKSNTFMKMGRGKERDYDQDSQPTDDSSMDFDGEDEDDESDAGTPIVSSKQSLNDKTTAIQKLFSSLAEIVTVTTIPSSPNYRIVGKIELTKSTLSFTRVTYPDWFIQLSSSTDTSDSTPNSARPSFQTGPERSSFFGSFSLNPSTSISSPIHISSTHDSPVSHAPSKRAPPIQSYEFPIHLLSLPIGDLSEVHQRHYQHRPVGVELFFTNRPSIFLNLFDRNKAYAFRHAIESLRLPRLTPLSEIMLLRQLMKTRSRLIDRCVRDWVRKKCDLLCQDWKARRITNYKYLLQLNLLAGRSFNDLGQYPVFPWVLSDYSSPALNLKSRHSFRDFRYSIGAQDEAEREAARTRYDDLQTLINDDPMGHLALNHILPFHFGSHYSVPGFILLYLLRVEPFTSLHRDLQGGKFDRPDRLFFSLDGAWKSCLKNANDNKELIPELFNLPEVFLNLNSNDFGKTQRGVTINDVELPPWARDSSFELIFQHRLALESEYVSQNIHHWIDLIFGYKQRPPYLEGGNQASVEACNVYCHLTYNGSVNLDELEQNNPTLFAQYMTQITEYGQTPSQLFSTPHPPRIPLHQTDFPWKIASITPGMNTELSTADRIQKPRLKMHKEIPISKFPIIFLGDSSDGHLVTVDVSRNIGFHGWTLLSPDEDPCYKLKIDIPQEKGRLFSRYSSNRKVISSPFAPEQRTSVSFEGRSLPSDPAPHSPTSAQSVVTFSQIDPTIGSSATLGDYRYSEPIKDPHLLPTRFSMIPDTRLLVSCGHWDNSIRITNVGNGKLVQTLTTHSDLVTCISISRGTKCGRVWMGSGSRDCRVMIWDVTRQTSEKDSGGSETDFSSVIGPQPVFILYGHDDSINSLSINVDLDVVVSGSEDGLIVIHSLREGSYIRCIDQQVPIHPSQTPHSFDPQHDVQHNQFHEKQLSITWLGLSPAGFILTYSAESSRLSSYSLSGLLIASTLAEESLFSFIFSHDGLILITGGDQCAVKLRWVRNLVLADDGPRKGFLALITGSSPSAHRPKNPEMTSPIRSLFLSTNEQVLVVGAESGELRTFSYIGSFHSQQSNRVADVIMRSTHGPF